MNCRTSGFRSALSDADEQGVLKTQFSLFVQVETECLDTIEEGAETGRVRFRLGVCLGPGAVRHHSRHHPADAPANTAHWTKRSTGLLLHRNSIEDDELPRAINSSCLWSKNLSSASSTLSSAAYISFADSTKYNTRVRALKGGFLYDISTAQVDSYMTFPLLFDGNRQKSTTNPVTSKKDVLNQA